MTNWLNLTTIPDRVDVLVAWLATDTSLIEPSHLSVSVDELLSEQSLLMLPVLLEMLLELPLRFGVWKSCDDQLMARDCSSWLSWRSLYSQSDMEEKAKNSEYTSKPLIIIIYSLNMYVFCQERRQLNIRKIAKATETFKKLQNWRAGVDYLHISFFTIRANSCCFHPKNSLPAS